MPGKRKTAIGKMKKSRSHKTAKRLEKKSEMLAFKKLKPSERRKLSAK